MIIAAAAASFHAGLMLTAFGLGFRHGIDWDHIAAITDISGSHEEGRRSFVLATMYILGHALVVLALGVAAIVLAEQLPDSVDAVMERVVGATLVLLGVYVIVSLLRHGRDFRMKSRWMLVFGGVRRGVRWVRRRRESDPLVVVTHEHAHDPSEPHPDAHEHAAALVGGPRTSVATEHRHGHRHIGSLPDDPFDQYGKPTAFGVGMIHGVGAETPTQVLLFLAAAGAGGEAKGLLLLACFIVGLVSSNTLIAGASTFGFLNAARNWHVYVTVSVITAVFSLVIGTLFLTGGGSVLPAFFAG